MRHIRSAPALAAATALSAAFLATAFLASCGTDGPPPRVPMPSNVPTSPQFADSDAVVAALGRAGIPCLVTLHTAPEGASTTECTATLDGRTFQYEVAVFDLERFSRDEIGNAIATGRTVHHQTFVAAGNWHVAAIDPEYAPRIAQALGGVVLPGDELKIPDYPLPAIPSSPRFDSVESLAAALDSAVGCEDHDADPGGSLTCRTGSRVGHSPNCAVLRLHPSDADRDHYLREAISHPAIPAYLATGANWSVNLCDYGLADRVAADLGGVVVSYDGN
ncbi:hypothetical protein [Kitasatospora sp. CB01950]|uniref:hypothetical protein n=1 Tax=Kitasatospora sp. CB01950 TaxID=1703930 RepID=UPI00093B0C13|nr:hypothetical protein [Kitasatospora sp. CB01950]OKJ10103.1 hypothetical protein AMK19_14380 [Kitasatospora sp. CB01950]